MRVVLDASKINPAKDNVNQFTDFSVNENGFGYIVNSL
jgi:hypothetical protein